MSSVSNAVRGCKSQASGHGEFMSKLPTPAIEDLESLALPVSYPVHTILFSEKDPAKGVYIVLEGEIKLSINSAEGKRLSLSIARKGEILGLTSALTGSPYEMTAETIFPAKLAPISRHDFLNYLLRHPEAYQILSEDLSRQYSMACEQLRTVGLSNSAPEKLARLLLDWSENGQITEAGTRFRFSLTHEEIGEFIGASRETVTRTLSTFKVRRLVMCNGSTLTIPSRTALANYAHC
jgi:CRP/FNR family transcriptional regulator, cyclic AMP receptor protein